MASTTPPMAPTSSNTGITTSTTASDPTVRSAPTPAWWVLVPLAVFVGAAAWLGTDDRAGRVLLGAAPLVGRWDPELTRRALLPISVAAVAVAVVPLAADRLRFGAALVVGWLWSILFTVTLAGVDGRDAIAAPLGTGFEYRAILGDIESVGVGTFVRDFVTRLPEYPTHVRGHPVGASLVFWAQEQIGLVGVEWSAALVIVVGTSSVVSVGSTLRHVVSEAAARRAIPFLVLVPAVVWVGTTMDAFIAGTVAASVALFAWAATGTRPVHDVAALVGGVVGAFALHLSYGATVMLVSAVVLVLARRRVRPIVVGAVGAAAVTAGFVALGFWWFDGLAATRVEYFAGAGSFRPYWYFATFGNLGALAIALGPAVAVAIARVRDRRAWLVVGSALLGVALADVSGMSKGEVERIWLPFVPWLVTATVVFRPAHARWWLALQATVAIALQLCLVSPW